MTITGRPAPARARRDRVTKWAPLAVLLCGTFVSVLDFFIVNVALPDIQRGLEAGPAAIEWVVAGYALTSASLLVSGGRLGDRFGRRATLRAGLAVFALASALCAVAPDAGFLVATRLAQGAGAAIMSPNVLSILGVTYTGRDRIRAISAYGIVMGLAAAGGQLLGGALISAGVAGLGWRAIFWVNVPVCLLAWAAALRAVPESRGPAGTRLDLVGAGLLTAGLVAVVLPLSVGREQGWPAWSLGCLAAGPMLLGVLAAWLVRLRRVAGQPLLDPGIFAVRAFRSGLAVQLLFWCQQAAGYLVLALYLQLGRGLSPVASGGVFSVLAAGYLVTSFRAPALTVRFGRLVIAVGAVTAAGGDLLLGLAAWQWGAGGPVLALFPGLLILGAGQGLCITPLTATVLSHASPATAGSVSGALATAQQVGNAIGVTVTGVVFFGLASRGYRAAFGWSVAEMGTLLLVTAAFALASRKVEK